MKIDYYSKKWPKEVKRLKEFLKECGGKYYKNLQTLMNDFEESLKKDYLYFHMCLYSVYRAMARYLYLQDTNCTKCIEYTYLSGLAFLYTKKMYDNGVRSDYNCIIENWLAEIDYALYELIAVDETNFSIFNTTDNLICLMVKQDYNEAKKIIDMLPDDVDDSNEVYYVDQIFLKNIYKAIIDSDEKKFNEEIVKRIKKYRRNMVGYSTIIDVVSIALIKMAMKVGIKCKVDVIEIPKMFFEESNKIDKNSLKLPFFDEFMNAGLINDFD